MSFVLSILILALGLTGLSWGIYLSVRIFRIPDITTDGAFTLGAATTAMILAAGESWITALAFSLLAGIMAGSATGIVHSFLKVDPLLSGILVMTALYSVNLLIMGRSNIPLIETSSIFDTIPGERTQLKQLGVLLVLISMTGFLLRRFLKTDLGLVMRATGDSESMVRAMGTDPRKIKVLGLAIANMLTAASGSLVAQIQQFTDINMGIGIVVFGLGAVMIGKALQNTVNARGPGPELLFVLLGCVVFRAIMGLLLLSGIDPYLMKLATSSVVLLFVGASLIRRQNA